MLIVCELRHFNVQKENLLLVIKKEMAVTKTSIATRGLNGITWKRKYIGKDNCSV